MAKDTAKIRQQLHEILDIVLDCNGFESRARHSTGTLPTAFMDFSGHVSSITVRIFTDGWYSGGNERDWTFRTDDVIPQAMIDSMRSHAEYSLTNKRESEVLSRDIEAQEQTIKYEQGKLASLKKSYKKAVKKEGAA